MVKPIKMCGMIESGPTLFVTEIGVVQKHTMFYHRVKYDMVWYINTQCAIMWYGAI